MATRRGVAKGTGVVLSRIALIAAALFACAAAFVLIVAASHAREAGMTSLYGGGGGALTSLIFAVINSATGRYWKHTLVALAVALICAVLGYVMAVEDFVI